MRRDVALPIKEILSESMISFPPKSLQISRTDVISVEIGDRADDVSQLSREPWLNPIDRRRP